MNCGAPAVIALILAATSAPPADGAAARAQAELLACAGEARYRLALLRAPEGSRAEGADLADALRALEEARSLDPVNLRALAYLGLARVEAARRPGSEGPAFDVEAFRTARAPLEELFRLSRGWADPGTRAVLKEVVHTLDDALASPAVAPEARAWWQAWRRRAAVPERPGPQRTDAAALRETLRSSPFAWERDRAADGLARGPSAEAGTVEALALALREDRSPWVRAACARALGRLRPPGWDLRLAEALRNDNSVWVRRVSAESLSRGKDRALSSAAYAAVRDALERDAPLVATEAALTLGSAGGADDLLLRALESDSVLVREAAASALRRRSGATTVLDRLAALLSDARAEVRAAAAQALYVSASDVPRIRSRLLELLDDPEPEVRAAAARAFMGSLREADRPRFLALLADEDPRVRLAAAAALHSADRTDEAALAALRSLRGSLAPVIEAGDLRTVGESARGLVAEREETEKDE